MPTYEYACRDCEEHVEVVQSFREAPLEVCGLCGGRLRKVFSAAGIIFKGSGYYVTDTRERPAQTAGDSGGTSSGSSSGSSSDDSSSGSATAESA